MCCCADLEPESLVFFHDWDFLRGGKNCAQIYDFCCTPSLIFGSASTSFSSCFPKNISPLKASFINANSKLFRDQRLPPIFLASSHSHKEPYTSVPTKPGSFPGPSGQSQFLLHHLISCVQHKLNSLRSFKLSFLPLDSLLNLGDP